MGEARSPAPDVMTGKPGQMTTTAPKQRSETAEQILDLAETLIQTARLQRVQLSGHRRQPRHPQGQHPLPLCRPKADLGRRRRRSLHRALRRGTRSPLPTISRNPRWRCSISTSQPYLHPASTPDQVCLSGALAGEMMALPPEVRARVDHFFKTHQIWLTKIFKRGVARGEFRLPAPATEGGAARFRSLAGRAAGQAHHRRPHPRSATSSAVMKLQLAAHDEKCGRFGG